MSRRKRKVGGPKPNVVVRVVIIDVNDASVVGKRTVKLYVPGAKKLMLAAMAEVGLRKKRGRSS